MLIGGILMLLESEWNSIQQRYICSDDVKKYFSGKDIMIWGGGNYGEKFIEQFSNIINIKYVIDNNIFDQHRSRLKDIPVINSETLKSVRNCESIIITSLGFATEIQIILENQGYVINKDFYVWNPHMYKKDDNVERLIRHNHVVWKQRKVDETNNNRILIRHYTGHESIFIDWSYFGNYLACTKNAEICVFGNRDEFFDYSVNRMYQSFGVNHVLFTDASSIQKIRAKNLCNAIWPTLMSKTDWLDITVDDFSFGEEICSHYIRSHPKEVDINLREKKIKIYLQKMLEWIVFWLDYFKSCSNIKAVILGDGLYRDGIIRKIAIKYGVDVYSITVDQKYKWNKFEKGKSFGFYLKWFNQLSVKDQKNGVAWAKQRLKMRLAGDISDIKYVKESAYLNKSTNRKYLKDNDKIKVMICPHLFGDDPYGYGKFLFPDHWEWLCYLGNISERTNYDWYLKVHPSACELDWSLLKKFVRRYPQIKILPHDVSPIQLKREGMQYAMTVWGTIGHEYPLLGIQVINAGPNPHCAFDFTWNPLSIKEYESIILHLPSLKKEIRLEDIYKFYSMHYLFFNNIIREDKYSVCYKSDELIRKLRTLVGRCNTERYKEFLEEWSPERHAEILKNVEFWIHEIDDYSDEIFTKNRYHSLIL